MASSRDAQKKHSQQSRLKNLGRQQEEGEAEAFEKEGRGGWQGGKRRDKPAFTALFDGAAAAEGG